MNYVRLIQEAWSLTWRNKFLWVLGLFAGGSAGSCSGPGFNFPGDWSTPAPGDEAGAETMGRWIADNIGLLIVLVVLLIVLALAFLVISLISKGAMARSTADLARGRECSLRLALRSGLQLLWRFLGLWLLLTALTVLVALIVGAFVVMAFLVISAVDEGPRVALTVMAVLMGFLIASIAIPAMILFSIALAYAQRTIAVEELGPLRALRSGVILLRHNLGTSLLVWLMNLGIGIAVGIAMFFVALAFAIPLIAVGAILVAMMGFGAITIAYIVLAVLLLVVVFWAVSAVSNAYTWSYWTLAYLHLRGEISLR